jgi:hypothetical protein
MKLSDSIKAQMNIAVEEDDDDTVRYNTLSNLLDELNEVIKRIERRQIMPDALSKNPITDQAEVNESYNRGFNDALNEVVEIL